MLSNVIIEMERRKGGGRKGGSKEVWEGDKWRTERTEERKYYIKWINDKVLIVYLHKIFLYISCLSVSFLKTRQDFTAWPAWVVCGCVTVSRTMSSECLACVSQLGRAFACWMLILQRSDFLSALMTGCFLPRCICLNHIWKHWCICILHYID